MFSWLSGSGKRQSEGASFGQSPSAPPDVRGRLNFSSLGTPRPPPAPHLTRDDAPSSSSYAQGTRLGEYHRSRQNPSVLDQFISSQTPQNLYKSSPTVRSTSERFNLFPSPATHALTTGVSPLSRRTQTPFRRSPFQMNQSAFPFGTGLVGMAVRSRLRHSESPGISPVMVHIPGAASTGVNRDNEGASARGSSQLSEGNEVDPCDREVVMSALKQKRKRWACHSGDDVVGNAAESAQPAAKRSRHGTEQPRSSSLSPASLFTRPSLHSRKRDHTSSGEPLTSALSQSLKKPRVFHPPSSSPWKRPTTSSTTRSSSEVKNQTESEEGRKTDAEVVMVRDHVTMPETGQPREEPSTSRFVSGSGTGTGRSLKLLVPESEYESDSESVKGVVGGGGGGVKGDGVEESSVDSGRGSRGSTPPVQEEEEEESREDERNRRNRAELQRLHKSLTAVFPSLHKTSSRRKAPVFCATGSASIQCPSLSPAARGVTWEDWRKEGEMAQARLQSFWDSDNDPPAEPDSSSLVEKPSSATTGITNIPSPLAPSSSSSSSVDPRTQPSETAVSSSTAMSTSGGKLPGAKSVTFQLPNVVTSTQSLSSVPTASSQTNSATGSGSGSGMGLGPGTGLSSLVSQTSASAVPTASSSLPPPSLLSFSSSASQLTPTLSNYNVVTQQQQQPIQQQQQQQQQQKQQGSQPQQEMHQQKQQERQLHQEMHQQKQQERQLHQEMHQQQQRQQILQPPVVQSAMQSLPSSLARPSAFGNFQTTPTVTPTSTLPQTIPATSTVTLPSSSLPSLPPLSQLGHPSTNQTLQQSLTAPQPLSLSLPLQPQQQQTSSLLSSQQQQTSSQQQQTSSQQQLLSSQQQQTSTLGTQPQSSSTGTLPSVSASTSQSAKFPGLSLGFRGPPAYSGVGSTPGGFKLGSGGGLGLLGAAPALAVSGTGSGNVTQVATISGVMTPGLQLQQVQSSATPAQQNSAPGGLLRLGQTSQLPTATSSSGGFNFGGGFKFSSGGPTMSQTPQQTPPKLTFGGATPQGQNPLGGLNFGGSSGVGGAFGTALVTTTAPTAASLTTPTFNFTATSSSATLGTQKIHGGIFGGSALQKPSVALPSNPTPPAFNFGATGSQPTQQQQSMSSGTGNAGSGMFNFSTNPQKQTPSLSTGALIFGGGGAGNYATAGPVYNFSAAAGSQTGSKVSGSGTGLGFGATPAAPGGSGGFNFSAAGAASSTAVGGLSFGGSTGGVAFSGSTNQIQPGGIFGQNMPSNNPSTPSVFNPSLATPSKPPQMGGFNFTPQPSATGFNFSASAGTPGGINFGSPGVGGGALFSAGTPTGGEASRPVATARRRNRGRRK